MNRGVKAAAIIVLVLGALAAVFFFVFRIRSIDVRGNSRYSAEQIRDDLIRDSLSHNTLYFSWKYRSKGPAADAPYLTSVQAVMVSPTQVRIQVEESPLIGRIEYNGQNVYFDANGMIQEISDKVYERIPLVSGIVPEEPQLYQKLALDNASTLRTMLNITQLLMQNSLFPDSVTFDESGNMKLQFGNVKVKLGQDEYLEEKIANLVTIYPQISGQAGTLNMEGFTGKNEAITFKSGSDRGKKKDETEEDKQDAAEGSDVLAGAGGDDTAGEDAGDEEAAENQSFDATFMVFDSSGTLRYNAHVVNGQVVDANGNVIDGCYVNEDGNAVDAYWNVIDPATGQLVQQ